MLDNTKSVSNFNFPLVYVGKIKLNSRYKKMIEKMYDNLQEKYKKSVFQILDICKAFTNFGFNSTIGKSNCVVQFLKIKIMKRFLLISQTSKSIHPRTYLVFSILLLDSKEN